MEKIKSHLGIILTGLIVGAVSVVLVAFGNPLNMGFCIACFLRDIAGGVGLHRAAAVQYIRPEIIGLVLGALIMALAGKEFKVRGGSSPMARFVLGFCVMVGALMFLGCPLRMVIRLGGGDGNAILGLIGFILGIFIGTLFLKKGFSLKKSQPQNRVEGTLMPAVAAALLAGVLVTALYLSRPAGITEEAAVRQTAVVLPDGTGDTAVPDTYAGSDPPQTVSGAHTPQPVRAVAKTDGEDPIPERQTAAAGQENAPAGKDTEARDAPPAVREGDRNGQRGRSRKRPAYPSPGSAAAELRRNTDAYWERAIAREYGGAPRRKVAGSVYAGNFGTFAGNSVTNDPDRAASAGMLIKQTSDGGMTLQSGLHEENGRPVLAPTGPVTEEVRLQHRMPLNVGLSLSVPLGERLALTTGLNYSYLYSSSEQSFSAGTAHITRELHYIGVPVGLTYTFYRAGGFGFYVQGGGMVEKGVAWRETQGFADAGDSGRESTLRRIKGVQFSVSAAAGVSYNFNRHIGLYVEPGVGYYFRQKDQPASYRTVHPTSFSVKVGVRFGL